MFCSTCGGSNPDGAAYCATCGRPLSGQSPESVPAPPAPQPFPHSQPISQPQPFAQPQPAQQAAAPPANWRTAYPCLVCGATLGYSDFVCKRCRTPRGKIADPYAESPGEFIVGTALWDTPDRRLRDRPLNSSGQGGEVPAEVARGWNWGAFWLSVLWGISHRTYQTLIVFVLAIVTLCADGIMFISKGNMLAPMGVTSAALWLAGIPLSVWYGRMGNRWAWQNREFRSIEEFRMVQKIWSVWALVAFGTCALGALAIGLAISSQAAFE